MRLLCTLCLGLAVIALQVVLGIMTFYPEAFDDKTDAVSEIVLEKKPMKTLSAEEMAWIRQHPVISVGVDPSFYPVETFDERGRYTGLAGDYLSLLKKLAGLDFRVMKLQDWASTEIQARDRGVDMFMAAARTNRRSEYMLFTEPYINLPGLIMTRRGNGLDKAGINDLHGKKVAVVNNYSWHDFLREHHPAVVALPAANTLEALQYVAAGEADAVIDYEFNLVEQIQAGGIMQVQPAGSVDSSYGHAVAARNDWPVFFSVISKALAEITPNERGIIARKWLEPGKSAGDERRGQWLFFFVSESILLCILLFWLWETQLRKRVKEACGVAV